MRSPTFSAIKAFILTILIGYVIGTYWIRADFKAHGREMSNTVWYTAYVLSAIAFLWNFAKRNEPDPH